MYLKKDCPSTNPAHSFLCFSSYYVIRMSLGNQVPKSIFPSLLSVSWLNEIDRSIVQARPTLFVILQILPNNFFEKIEKNKRFQILFSTFFGNCHSEAVE